MRQCAIALLARIRLTSKMNFFAPTFMALARAASKSSSWPTSATDDEAQKALSVKLLLRRYFDSIRRTVGDNLIALLDKPGEDAAGVLTRSALPNQRLRLQPCLRATAQTHRDRQSRPKVLALSQACFSINRVKGGCCSRTAKFGSRNCPLTPLLLWLQMFCSLALLSKRDGALLMLPRSALTVKLEWRSAAYSGSSVG